MSGSVKEDLIAGSFSAGGRMVVRRDGSVTPLSVTSPGDVKSGGALAGGVETLVSANGLLPTLSGAKMVSLLTTNGVGNNQNAAASLADGEKDGAIKMVVGRALGGGSIVLTPLNMANGSSITFSVDGDACTMVWADSEWHLVGLHGNASKA